MELSLCKVTKNLSVEEIFFGHLGDRDVSRSRKIAFLTFSSQNFPIFVEENNLLTFVGPIEKSEPEVAAECPVIYALFARFFAPIGFVHHFCFIC